MPQLITDDDLFDLIESGDPNDDIARNRAIARTAEAWATDSERFELDDELRSAELLIVAAEHLEAVGDLPEAERLARLAVAAGDAEGFEAHPALLSVLLAAGDEEAAIAVADEVRLAGVDEDPDLAHEIAEVFELAGRFDLAERWYVIGLNILERHYEFEEEDRWGFLANRYLVRREQGRPADVLDTETEALAEELEANLGEMLEKVRELWRD